LKNPKNPTKNGSIRNKNITKNKSIKTKEKNKKLKLDDDEEQIDEEENLEDLVFPGQKYPTPILGDPTRAFYESLLEQKPDSLMALKWCIDYGCLDQTKVNSNFTLIYLKIVYF